MTTDDIAIAAKVVRVRQAVLAELIADACPGPHRYVQHRDDKPPWCPACRYTEAGQKIPREDS